MLKIGLIATAEAALGSPVIVVNSDGDPEYSASSSSEGASSVQVRADDDHAGTFAQAITIAADDGPPAVVSPVASQIGANQVTLTFQADNDATGYFTLIPGADAPTGTGAQIAAGNDSLGKTAFRQGSLLLRAGEPKNYTLRNLPGSTAFTVAFTASDGTTLQEIPASASFTTAVSTSLAGMSWRLPENALASDDSIANSAMDFAPDGTPYVVYQVTTWIDGTGTGSIFMKRFVDESWQQVGPSIAASSDRSSLAFAFGPGGDPYLAYRDPAAVGAITVVRYTQEGWGLVGMRGLSSGPAEDACLAFGPDGKPYLAYRELTSPNAAVVQKFDGSEWQAVGGTNASAGPVAELSLAVGLDGTPYIAYADKNDDRRAHLRHFVGGAWSDASQEPLPSGVDSLDLAIAPDGTPTVASSSGFTSVVVQLVSGQWRNLPFAAGDFFRYQRIRLAILPDATPVIFFYNQPAWWVGSLGAREYRNGTWSNHYDISLGLGWSLSPAIAPDGTPWIACPVSESGGRAAVYAMMHGPKVIRVDPLGDGTYGPDETLEFRVKFNEPVTYTAAPMIDLTVGETETHAVCIGGDRTDTLIFRLTVTIPMNDTDGIEVAPFINENSGKIVSLSQGVRADSRIFANTANVLVDTIAPNFTGPTQASGYFGRALDYSATSDDPGVTFSASGLPPGLTMDAAGRLIGTPTATGSYSITVYVTDHGGNQTAAQTTLTIEEFPRIVNISARAHAGTRDEIIIVGFVITGNDPLPILARAVGPSLIPLGVSAPLANPRLVLYRGNDRIYANDDWEQADADALVEHMARLGAFGLSSRDAAVLVSLPPGAYTMHVLASEYAGASELDGVALAEIYDASATPSPGVNRLVNISSRARVSSGENVEIGGFVITGSQRRVLIRGIGPGLSAFGVSTYAPNPILRLYRGNELVATSDNWGSQPEVEEIISVSNAVGAFPLEPGSTDAVLLMTLEPGIYTAHVGAADETPDGIALAEVYELPE